MIQADIRAAVRAALLAGTGLTSDHIWAYPNAAIPTALMPGISVFTISDKPVREDDDHAVQHERLFTFVVDVQVAAPQAESATDALATLVRTSLLSDDTLGRTVFAVRWMDQTWGSLAGSPSISGTALTFTAHYLWTPN